MFKGVKTINTKQAIVHQLISLIKRGSLKPGDKLPSENELMEMLKVGRSSIREAKQILAAMNLIETRPGQGSFVKEVGPETVINADIIHLVLADETVWALHEAREILEIQVAGLAAQRATEDDLAAMEKVLQGMRDAIDTNTSVYDAGMEFHFALVKAAHNAVLLKLYYAIMSLLQEYQRPIYERHSDPETELQRHREIYESICKGDRELAQKVMRDHLRYVHSITAKVLGEKGSPRNKQVRGLQSSPKSWDGKLRFKESGDQL